MDVPKWGWRHLYWYNSVWLKRREFWVKWADIKERPTLKFCINSKTHFSLAKFDDLWVDFGPPEKRNSMPQLSSPKELSKVEFGPSFQFWHSLSTRKNSTYQSIHHHKSSCHPGIMKHLCISSLLCSALCFSTLFCWTLIWIIKKYRSSELQDLSTLHWQKVSPHNQRVNSNWTWSQLIKLKNTIHHRHREYDSTRCVHR